ncbi:MAG: hypothetical protein ACYC5Q_04780 [Thermoleophilia bacterium]
MVTMGEGGGSTGVNPRFSSSATTNPALFLNRAAMRVWYGSGHVAAISMSGARGTSFSATSVS